MDVGAALSRLLRPDQSPVLRVLEAQRLTVADVVAAAETPSRVDWRGTRPPSGPRRPGRDVASR